MLTIALFAAEEKKRSSMLRRLQACDFWDAIKQEHESQPLPADPTIAQIRNHREEKAKSSKQKHVSTLQFQKQYSPK